MLFAVTGLLKCPVEATDGHVGEVKDFLFDDETWQIRWMAVDTGVWLPGRKVLIHPSAIEPIVVTPPDPMKLPMMTGPETPVVNVRLTKEKIEAGPPARDDEAVTQAMEVRLYEYYGWDPAWGASYVGAAAVTPTPAPSRQAAEAGGGDPRLHSAVSVRGYRVHETDGDLGHVENFLADDANWDIRYLVLATHNWLPGGRHVQLAPFAVTAIDSVARRVSVNITRDQVKSSPAWDPLSAADELAEQRLHKHYGWPGYGWIDGVGVP